MVRVTKLGEVTNPSFFLSMNYGISFLMRVHNEELTLEKSVRSLELLDVPYNVSIILNNCTDNSEQIANKLQDSKPFVKVYNYALPVSRAGYETLCTDSTSPHSIPFYLNWCLRKCDMPWVFKWDGDFVMTSSVANYLNHDLKLLHNAGQCKNTKIRINAVNSTSRNGEFYLANCFSGFDKYYFWEVTKWPSDTRSIDLSQDLCVLHDSELKQIKNYWLKPPWFYEVNTPEANKILRRYNQLVAEYGPEPAGMARASNPECDRLFLKIRDNSPYYVNPFS